MTVTSASATTISYDDDPIADFISALVLTGEYVPGKYGITTEMIRRHKKVHTFCTDHQQHTNEAPTPELLTRKFPDFPFTDLVLIEWAAQKLRENALGADLSVAVTKAGKHIIDEEPVRAWEVLNDAVRTSRPVSARPVNVFDEAVLRQPEPTAIPVGVAALQRITNGIRPGELWYVGARPGRGKSWDLLRHAVAAATHGCDAVIFSMEMSIKEMSKRLLALLWGYDVVDSWDEDRIVLKAQAWMRDKGNILIYDQSIRRCDVLAIESAAAPNTLLLVDHVGLMRSTSGSRAVEDYKVAASISNDLKEIAQRHSVPIIAASQLNRKSEGNKHPSLADLAQTDAAGQDADLVYAMFAAEGSRVQENTLIKNRRGPARIKWYTDFRPAVPSFEEITRKRAVDLLEQESGVLDFLMQ